MTKESEKMKTKESERKQEQKIEQERKSIMSETLKNLKKIREMLDLTDLKQTA